MIRDTMVYYRSFRESLRELPPDLYKVVVYCDQARN